MLNKSFGVIYFHFNIFSEETAKQLVLKFAFLSLVSLAQSVFQSGLFHTTSEASFCSLWWRKIEFLLTHTSSEFCASGQT